MVVMFCLRLRNMGLMLSLWLPITSRGINGIQQLDCGSEAFNASYHTSNIQQILWFPHRLNLFQVPHIQLVKNYRTHKSFCGMALGSLLHNGDLSGCSGKRDDNSSNFSFLGNHVLVWTLTPQHLPGGRVWG